LAHLGRGHGIERVVLDLDRPAAAGEGPAGEALCDEPSHADRPARRQQMVGSLCSQAIGGGEVTIEVAQVHRARQRGELVHDHLGLRLCDGARDLLGNERVGDRRRRTELADGAAF
jgi:hypothetical protein